MSTLYGVGVGSGDPELLTLKAVKILTECDVIAVPSENLNNSVAYGIIKKVMPEISEKEIIGLSMPMIKSEQELNNAHQMGTDLIVSYLSQNKSVAFITLGDPSIYSTFTYIQNLVKSRGFETEIVNGISSFLSVASVLNTSLVSKDESLHIIPSNYGIEEALQLSGTIIFMKAGNMLDKIKDALRRTERKVFFIENCGMENEMVIEGVDNFPDKAGYFSIVVVFN